MRRAPKGCLRRLEALWSHPAIVGSVLLLVLNDHYFKHAFPGQVWTGKLSDFAGMLFFPALVWTLLLLVSGGRRPREEKTLQWSASLATALVFGAIQASTTAGEIYAQGLGALQLPFRAAWALIQGAPFPAVVAVAHTPDLTDLWALPAVLWLPLCFAPGGEERPKTVGSVLSQ